MFVLKHIFRLRESSSQYPPTPDGDMPFLDHLEDLRRTIIRMALTLLISMLLCFGFAPALMQILRQPIESVWQEHTCSLLPAGTNAQEWQQARTLASMQPALPPRCIPSRPIRSSPARTPTGRNHPFGTSRRPAP